MKTLIIGAGDIEKIVVDVGLDVLMDELILRLTDKLSQLDRNQIESPTRSGFAYTQPEVGLLEWMPVREGHSVTIKIVGYHPSNPSRYQAPTILATVSSYDSRTGHLVGLADGTFLTAMRTGAASGVASRILAKPDASVVGLIGCGAQAVSQLHALVRLFPIDQVLVHDLDADRAISLQSRVSEFGRGLEVTPSPLADIVGRADILCTSTSIAIGDGPLFDDMAHLPWLHVNAVGSDFPGKFELPLEMLQRAFVCPDFPEQALREGESQRLSATELGPSLDGLVKDPSRYRRYQGDLTVFDSTGWALTDQVALGLLIEHARRLSVGDSIELETSSGDPYSPYSWAVDGQVQSGGVG